MDYFVSIKNKKNIIIIITCLMVILSLSLSFLHPLEYSSTNQLIIIQPTENNVDVYNAIKGVERTSEKLAQVIYTTSFFDKVVNSGFNIDTAYFKQDEKKKRKQWEKMIDTQVIRGSGMLKIQVYHQNKFQASEISRAIGYVLNTSGWEYVGNKSIEIREVDSPLVSNWPVRPNFALNGFIGLILGLMISFGYVLISEQKNILVSKYQSMTANMVQTESIPNSEVPVVSENEEQDIPEIKPELEFSYDTDTVSVTDENQETVPAYRVQTMQDHIQS